MTPQRWNRKSPTDPGGLFLQLGQDRTLLLLPSINSFYHKFKFSARAQEWDWPSRAAPVGLGVEIFAQAKILPFTLDGQPTELEKGSGFNIPIALDSVKIAAVPGSKKVPSRISPGGKPMV